GSLLAAFVLITFGGLDTALTVAAAVNGFLGILILGCRLLSPERSISVSRPAASPSARALDLRHLVFTTGFLAIGYEIVWFRFFGVLVKESSYAFATILAVYLTGRP